jgi:hypothetical protein
MKQFFVTKNFGWLAGLAIAAMAVQGAAAQKDTEQHGRKWQPLPPTAHVVVTVLKGFNGKPLPNAAVIFHATRNGVNDGNLEVKTDPEGKATIDVIEQGSHVTVQVIATGFATSATEIDVDGPSKELEVKLIRPRAQVSTYVDNDGKAAQVKPGIQEPAHTSPAPSANINAPMTPASGTPSDPTKPTAIPVGNPTQLPGPLNAPPGTQNLPTQPGAPTTTAPPVAPPPTGTVPPAGTPK